MLKTFLAAYAPWLYAGLAALVLAGAGWLYLKGRSDAAAEYKPKLEAAARQAQLDTSTAKTVETYHHDVTILHQRSEAATDAIRKAPTSDQPLDPSYRTTLCDQLARVREQPVCTEDRSPDHVPGAVPSAD